MSADCTDVVRNLYELLDGELSPQKIRELGSHVDFCSDCLRRLEVEKEFKELVRIRCGDEQAPQQLVEIIRERLRSELEQS